MRSVASLVTSEAEMHALAPLWSTLAGNAHPFLSPGWLLPWWRQFGTGRPVVAVVRTDRRLSGLLACYVLDEPPGGKLLPMGAGISDYLDALVEPGAPPETASLLLRTVLREAAGVRSCDLIDLPPGAALREAAAPADWRDETVRTVPCPVLVLPDPAVGLRHSIPAGTHRKLRMNRHRAERNGGWTHHIADPDGLTPALDALERLHGSRWSAGGVFADRRVLTCVRDAAPLLLRNGMLRLHTLRFGEEIVAACLAFAVGSDVLMLYLSGFDTAHASCSPGTILLGEVIETAIAERRREIHFLRGGEAYKYAWGAVDRVNADRRLSPR